MDSILPAFLFAPLLLIFGLANKAERYASITCIRAMEPTFGGRFKPQLRMLQ